MGWKTIGNKRYFYERRYGDGVTDTRYVGRGIEAQIAEKEAIQRALERAKDIAIVRGWEDRDRVPEAKSAQFEVFARATVDRFLGEKGFHQHKGQWRRRQKRFSMSTKESSLAELKSSVVIGKEPMEIGNAPSFGQEVRHLTLETLRGVRGCAVDQTISDVEAEVEAMRKEFSFDEASQYERLVIEQVLSAWVQWYVAGWHLESGGPDSRTERQNMYLDRKYMRSQVRLSRSIDQLAKLRCVPRSYLKSGRGWG